MSWAAGTKPGDESEPDQEGTPRARGFRLERQSGPVISSPACATGLPCSRCPLLDCLPAGQACLSPTPAAGSGLQRKDTPWPGWEGGQSSNSGSGGASPKQPPGQAPQKMPGTAPLEEAAEGDQGPGQRGAVPAGSPPGAPHHAGKPPPPEHSGLAGEEGVGGGSAADDLVPPVEDSAHV